MNKSERLKMMVNFALPKPCQFAEENFAGDPLVHAFCNMLRENLEIDFSVFITWACPPDVKVLQSRDGGTNAIIRSERFDTLLVEYFHLRRFHQGCEAELARRVGTASVLRWMSEFLIGYRQPELAVHALSIRPNTGGINLTSAFRDETLASLPEIERTALQCFSLGHEIGHLLISEQKSVTLNAIVDGVSLDQHMRTQEEQDCVVPDVALSYLANIRKNKIDAANLLHEIEIDLFAFGSIVDFLCQAFSCPVRIAIEAAMLAFECQAFIYGCKGTCRLLSQVASGALTKEEFTQQDYLLGVETATRARAVARRAGVVWAVIENPISSAGGRDYNAYVHKVDAVNQLAAESRTLTAEALTDHAYALLATLDEFSGPGSDSRSDSILNTLEQNLELRLDLYYILIAFGCSGATDPVAYLRQMRTPFPKYDLL